MDIKAYLEADLRFKKAFSLTELLIVLVILSVVFAATMPIVTKRKLSNPDFESQTIWKYVKDDDNLDSYYDVGSKGYPAVAYIGLDPSYKQEGGGTVPANSGKLTIKASAHATPYVDSGKPQAGIQRQIQFRYGDGMTGTLFADDYNLLLGAGYTKLLSYDGYIPKENDNKSHNTILGLHTADNISRISGSTIIGNNSMTQNDAYSHEYLTVVGNFSANKDKLSGPNVFVGHSTGGIPYVESSFGRNSGSDGRSTAQGHNVNINNVAVGYGALSEVPDGVEVNNNVFIGYNTGGYSYSKDSNHDSSGDYISNNVVIGTPYRMRQARNNTIIGYNTFEARNPVMQNLTAIGYNACSSVDVSGNNISRTCIGTNAGHFVSNPDYTTDIINTDGNGETLKSDVKDDRIFIGSAPEPYKVQGFKIAFPGRSVIEIHNIPQTYDSKNKIAPGATVVFNSNLVVRGKYFTSNNGDGIDSKYYIGGEKNPLINITGSASNGGVDPVCSTSDEVRPPRSVGRWASPRRRRFTRLTDKRNLFHRRYVHKDERTIVNPVSTAVMQMFDPDKDKDSADVCFQKSVVNPYKCFNGEFTENVFPKLYSDERLKTDISDSNIGLNEVLKLKPYNYVFKADNTKTPQVGVLAQDLIKIFPKSVFKGDDGFFRIRWDEMFYSVVNAIKELNAKIEKIASDVSKLEKSVLQIGNNQKVLKKRIAELNSKAARLEHK